MEKRKLKRNLLKTGDCQLIARKGELVDTYRIGENGLLWIKVGDTHVKLLFRDEEKKYFDM